MCSVPSSGSAGSRTAGSNIRVSLHASVPIIRMSWHFWGYIELRGREHLMLRNTSSRHTITEIVGGAGAFGSMFWVRDGDDE